MKKIVLTLIIIVCGLCLTFCQNKRTKTATGFLQPVINPSLYQNKQNGEVDLQDTEIIKKVHALDCYFEAKVKNNGFNGAVLIAYKGTQIFERYYGYKNYTTKERLTSKSTFQIASTSKTFTSAAILMLLQQNMLSLEDNLEKYFPGFPYKNITIRMLLNHRSGLPDYLRFSETYWKNKKLFMSNADVLKMMVKYKPAIYFNPDTHFKYTNTNFVLLALIVEKVSGMPFCDFMQENVFLPLGMQDSWIYDPLSPRPSATKGYKGSRWVEDAIVPTDGVIGDKGVYSTVRDLYIWDQALYAGKFIRPEYLGLAFTPQSFEKPGNKNYGLGWRITDQADGTRMIYHNGWWHSYTTAFNRKISDKSTLIVLCNHFSSNNYHSSEIWDILYGENSVNTEEEDGGTDITKKLNQDTLEKIKQ